MTRAVLVLLVGASLVADEPPTLSVRPEQIDPPKVIQTALRELLDSKCSIVSDKTGAIGSIWTRKDVPRTDAKGAPTYRSIVPGTLVGAVKLERVWNDFRGNEAPAGVYTLRIAVQPESKDHEGTAPYRDFCILVPAAEDAKPDILPLKTMVAKSGKATGGTHPIVMLLVPNPKPEAGPAILAKGKRMSIGVRIKDDFGFGFTIIGSWTD